jgi:hypothetical protein
MSARELAREAARSLVLLEGVKAVLTGKGDEDPALCVKLVRGILVGTVTVRLTPTVNPEEWRLELLPASREAALELGLAPRAQGPDLDSVPNGGREG